MGPGFFNAEKCGQFSGKLIISDSKTKMPQTRFHKFTALPNMRRERKAEGRGQERRGRMGR